MSMTDSTADMLTRIRNAIKAKHDMVDIPLSRFKMEILKILKEEGYIKDFGVKRDDKGALLSIKLKYTGDKKGAISNIKRISKPSLRRYVGKDEIPKVLNGLGIAILSTSRGILTDKKAAEIGIGGEIICTVY